MICYLTQLQENGWTVSHASCTLSHLDQWVIGWGLPSWARCWLIPVASILDQMQYIACNSWMASPINFAFGVERSQPSFQTLLSKPSSFVHMPFPVSVESMAASDWSKLPANPYFIQAIYCTWSFPLTEISNLSFYKKSKSADTGRISGEHISTSSFTQKRMGCDLLVVIQLVKI